MMKPALIVLIINFCIFTVHAQKKLTDSVEFENAVTSTADIYVKRVSEQAEIYNGREYNFLPRATKGSPYFAENLNFTPGVLQYNGTWYKNVSVLYDSFKDVLVATQPVNQLKFILHKHLLSEFMMLDRHFINIMATDSSTTAIPSGYYEQLYSGKTTVLCKWFKSRIETTSIQGIEVAFDDKIAYYIKKSNVYYNVNSKGSVLNVFKDKKKELSSYLNNNKINYKVNKALAIAKMAAYYDQISQ